MALTFHLFIIMTYLLNVGSRDQHKTLCRSKNHLLYSCRQQKMEAIIHSVLWLSGLRHLPMKQNFCWTVVRIQPRYRRELFSSFFDFFWSQIVSFLLKCYIQGPQNTIYIIKKIKASFRLILYFIPEWVIQISYRIVENSL